MNMEKENDLLKQYWEGITKDDSVKITWDEASKNVEAVEGLRQCTGFAIFKASLAISDAFGRIGDSMRKVLNLK